MTTSQYLPYMSLLEALQQGNTGCNASTERGAVDADFNKQGVDWDGHSDMFDKTTLASHRKIAPSVSLPLYQFSTPRANPVNHR